MERVYSISRPPIEQGSYLDWIANSKQKLSVSSRNLVAFTSSFCLNQSRPSSIYYHAYIADLNTPYQPYLLAQSENQFVLIEWDPSGTKLLVSDSQGNLTIYVTNNYLISDWKPLFKHTFSSELFISSLWYHSGLLNTIQISNTDLKSPSNHLEYTDKVVPSKFGASLRLFGGKSAEGCILISRTGLVVCLTLMSDKSVDIEVESLGPLRSRLEVADISYHPRGGSFVVGSSSGMINSTISFHLVSLSMKNITLDDVDSYTNSTTNNETVKRVSVECKQFNSFHLNLMSQILNESENTSAFERVSRIKFVTKYSHQNVLIEVNGPNLSLIELWELENKKKSPLHKAILEIKNNLSSMNNSESKESSINGEESDSKEWCFKGNYITDKELISIQVPRYKIFGNRQLNIIILAHKDSTICCLNKDDLQPLNETINLTIDDRNVSGLNGTKLSLNSRISSSQESISPYKVYSTSALLNQNLKGPHSTVKQQSQVQQLQSIPPMGTAFSTKHQHPQQANKMANYLDTNEQLNLITDLQLSSNQTLFVAIDSKSQMHVVRLPTLIQCQDDKDQETYLQYILEYCLVTGNDWWDLILCIGRDSIENICDKFQDAYERQPKHLQRMYSNRHLMIRASLYRCLNNASSLCKSSDCHSMLMLNSVSNTLKSMLRQSSAELQDSPLEQLASLFKAQQTAVSQSQKPPPQQQQQQQPQSTSATYLEFSSVIEKIKEKEFYIEPNLIQCLQPLIQWLVDLSIYLIASLVQRARAPQTSPNLPGSGLAKCKEALQTLRELLVITKIWSGQNEAGAPIVYKLSDQIDVIGTLYKLISSYHTQLSAATNNNRNIESTELDGQFLEESLQFINSITVPEFCYFLAATGVASPLLFEQTTVEGATGGGCLMLEYFREPTQVPLVQMDKVEASVDLTGERKVDAVRNISLGAHTLANIRHCTRCKALSLIQAPAVAQVRSSATGAAGSGTGTGAGAGACGESAAAAAGQLLTARAWEQRWTSSCICGGSWSQSNGGSLLSGVGGSGGAQSSASSSNKISAYHAAWLQGAAASQLAGGAKSSRVQLPILDD